MLVFDPILNTVDYTRLTLKILPWYHLLDSFKTLDTHSLLTTVYMFLTKSLEWSKGLLTKSVLDRRPFDQNLLVKRHCQVFFLFSTLFDQLLGQKAFLFYSYFHINFQR
jgi:hypothetical protein